MHIYNWVDLGISIFLAIICIALIIAVLRGDSYSIGKPRFAWLMVCFILLAVSSFLDATHLHEEYPYRHVFDIARSIAFIGYFVCSLLQRKEKLGPD